MTATAINPVSPRPTSTSAPVGAGVAAHPVTGHARIRPSHAPATRLMLPPCVHTPVAGKQQACQPRNGDVSVVTFGEKRAGANGEWTGTCYNGTLLYVRPQPRNNRSVPIL